MSNLLEPARFLRFALITLIAACSSVACGGSAVTSGDHNVGAGASGGDSGVGGTDSTGAQGGVGATAGVEATAGAGSKTVKLEPGSWQMTAVVTELQPNLGVMPCTPVAFTLNVAADGSDYSATIGKDGFIDGPTAQLTNGSYVLGGFSVPCTTQITVSGLTLQGKDTNGDGKADTLAGTASGMAYSGGGDVVSDEAIQVAFTGVPDVTAPNLLPPTDPVSPLLGFIIPASEPLAPSASLALAGSTNLALTAQPAHGSSGSAPVAALINWSTNVLLPLSGQWQIQGTGQDLIGHPLAAFGALATFTDPGLFAQDGFEGPLTAVTESGAPAIVTGFGSVMAISGAHSLWIAPGDALTFHLRRAAAENSVRFSARTFGSGGTPGFGVDVRAGVVGGQQAAMIANYPTMSSTVDTGDTRWPVASEVESYTLLLADSGTDVLLRISPLPCNGFCAPPVALLVDDLVLE
jgi:hypothetical protein